MIEFKDFLFNNFQIPVPVCVNNMGWIQIRNWIPIRNFKNSQLDPDPEQIIPNPQHCIQRTLLTENIALIWDTCKARTVHDPLEALQANFSFADVFMPVQVTACRGLEQRKTVSSRVVDPNTLPVYFDPNNKICPNLNLDPDPSFFTRLQ